MDWPFWTATAAAAALNFVPYAAAPAAQESNGWILPQENMFFYDPTLIPFQPIPPPFQEFFSAPGCILMPNILNVERRSALGRCLSNVVVGNRSNKVDVDTDHVNGSATMREPGDVDMDQVSLKSVALDPDTVSIENQGTDLGENPNPDSSSTGLQDIPAVEGTRVDSGCQEFDELQSAKEEVAIDMEGSAELNIRREPNETSPLVCKTCRMTFNADRQARQHFSGKYHARRVKLRDPYPGSDKQHTNVCNESTADRPSSEESANDSTPSQISPDVYCSSCAVAFNSSKQAAQHYNGKLHCKRTRFQNDKDFISKKAEPERQRDDRHEASSPSPPFVCPACDKLFNTPRLLKRHLKYAQHPFKIGGKLTMFIRTNIPRWPFCP